MGQTRGVLWGYAGCGVFGFIFMGALILCAFAHAHKGAALRVSGGPLKIPHPGDASGADYVRVKF